ncbi:hypothetical protein [Tomitella gaofuii]|uniref:hypothetical protein n=1 Tax=Tomitella gaofuii TaxID=2760083 RepID=UPI0015F8977F|nr:hypothetical protein [Tomitella gaofuii]
MMRPSMASSRLANLFRRSTSIVAATPSGEARRSDRPDGGTQLVLLCVVPPTIEESAVQAFGFTSAVGLAPAASATPVLGVFHDLRWLFVYHDSWWTFAFEALAVVLLRSAFVVAVARVMWPDGTERTPLRDTFRHTVTFTVATMAVLTPWVIVAMAASAMSLSWFALGEVVPVLFLILVLSRGGIVRQWWRGLPTPGALLWSFLGFLVMTAGALAIASVPGPWTIPVAGSAGAMNAWLWKGLVRSVVSAPVRWRWFPSVPAAFLTGAVALLYLTHAASAGNGGIQLGGGQQQAIARVQADVPDKTIMFVAGYGSAYRPPGTAEPTPPGPVRFSYRGVAQDGEPLGYQRIATHQSVATAAALLHIQVQDTARRTGKPVALVAQSEGTVIAHTYLALYPHRHVSDVVLLSPLVRPGRVYFPPAGAHAGWGIAAGWALRGMLTVARWAGNDIISHADEPFVRSIVDHGPFFRNTMLCPAPGVRSIIFMPNVAGAVVPPDTASHIPISVLPGLHATLLGEKGVDTRIATFLRGGDVGSPPDTAFRVMQRAAAAWESPALALAVNDAWPNGDDLPDASFAHDGDICSVPLDRYTLPGR